jgi:L-ascorbate metabolism protein UlaG (beta-lactamase superfamily)
MLLSRRKLATAGALLAAAGLGLVASRAWVGYYHGPISDHFDGERFFDPYGVPPKSVADLLRWLLFGRRPAWPVAAPSPFIDRPPPRVTGSGLRISFIGHASLLVQTGGHNLLVDPVWSPRASPVSFAGPKRVNDPGVPFEALPPIDTVLVSHCHYDHLDLATLSRLAGTHRPRVITPLGNDTIMHARDPRISAEAYDWHDHIVLSDSVAITLAPMRHWSARHVFDRNKALWAAFVITTPAGRLFHVADSGYGEGRHFSAARERYGPFRVAMLPIGAYEPRWFMRDQHMNPQEAVRALLDCGAEAAIAHHHGTFRLTDEEIDAPALALAAALGDAGLAPGRFAVLRPGQVLEL